MSARAHKNKVCVCVFIEMSVCAYVPTVFLKEKNNSIFVNLLNLYTLNLDLHVQ